jgi:AcrR family transcriptional regulator
VGSAYDRGNAVVAGVRGRQKTITAREARRHERRTVILGAAESLIQRDGLAGFSMRLLASEAGMPTPTLYGYFASKEAVLQSLAEEKIALLQESILRQAEDAAPGIDRLLAFARAYRRFAMEDTDFHDLFVSRSSLLASEDVRDMAMVPGIALIRTLATDVQAAVDREEIRPVDPVRTLVALWAMAQGYVTLELRNVLPEAVIAPDEREHIYLHYIKAVLTGMASEANGSGERAEGE